MRWAGDLAYPAQGRALYHAAQDPGETRDVFAARLQRARALDALAARFAQWNRAMAPAAPEAAGVSDTERRRLRDLGYVK